MNIYLIKEGPMGKKIVVVEDEPDILEVITYNLKREGFEVFSSLNGQEGYDLILKEQPSLVLLDLMLPGIDGLEICKKLKANESTQSLPVVMVTAKGEESDIVLGLGVGADDYISKPFSPKEMIARIKAVLRRTTEEGRTAAPTDQIKFPGILIDRTKHEVCVDEESVPFTATEFRLLHFLAAHPGRVFSREQLLKHSIGEGTYVVDRNIDVHVRVIRKKLGRYRDMIKTVRSIGYRFDQVELAS